ncbi:MAG: hypothetical protein LBB45_01065 [Methanobrevibacter sp.]|jgi:hypothetical protein|nr:hypothetical protein [Candidatus Methanovirga basalitermitum]
MGKIKITNAKVNKKLIGDEVTYQKVSTSKINPTKGGHGDGGEDPGKPKQPRKSKFDQILEFMKNQEIFNKEVVSFIKEQKEFNIAVITTLKEHGEAIAQLNSKVDKIESKLENVVKLNNLKS